MGRFEATVPFYRRFRQPYAAGFFAGLARVLELKGSEALIDIGCGPAPLALGMARYVGRLCGVDPEPAMIGAARAAAEEAGVALTLWEGRVEDLPPQERPFDVATIGRALHWLEPKATCAVLERLIGPRGTVVIAGSFSAPDENPWLAEYDQLRDTLRDETVYRHDPVEFFRGSSFAVQGSFAVRSEYRIGVDVLVGRLFSMSNTSLAKLGERAATVEQEMRRVLAPFTDAEGTLREVVDCRATLVSRASRT